MNEKWMNYGIIITLLMLFTNAFILVAASQPDQNNQFSAVLFGATNNNMEYSNISTDYSYTYSESGDSSQTPTNEQGFTPITNTSTGTPAGLDALSIVLLGSIGLELQLIQLALIFPFISPIFYAIISFALIIKAIVVAYLGSVLVRAIVGRQI